MRLGKSQEWLIDKLRQKLPDRYIDSSYLSKFFHGRFNSPEVSDAIDEILDNEVIT